MSNIRITYNERLEIEKNIGFEKIYRQMGMELGLHPTTIYQHRPGWIKYLPYRKRKKYKWKTPTKNLLLF